MPGSSSLLSSFVVLGALVVFTGCSPLNSSGEGASTSTNRPELTDELIYERINDTRVREVPVAEGTGDPIVWNFDHDEPKDIRVVEKQVDGNRAILILDIKTRSAPETRFHRELQGQIRTEWELQTGWVLRRWEIVRTENISMKYRDLTKPPQNSNSTQNNTKANSTPMQ